MLLTAARNNIDEIIDLQATLCYQAGTVPERFRQRMAKTMSIPFIKKERVWANLQRAAQVLASAAALLLVSLPLFSQANQGTIQGGVFDQSGGAVAGATVTVTDVARGVTRTLVTDSAGEYVAPNLTPGTYTVRARPKDFGRWSTAGAGGGRSKHSCRS